MVSGWPQFFRRGGAISSIPIEYGPLTWMMGLDKPVCPVQQLHPSGERRVPPLLDFDLADGETLARVSEESGLGETANRSHIRRTE